MSIDAFRSAAEKQIHKQLHDPDALAALRVDYRQASLNREDLCKTPQEQFLFWLGQAQAAQLPEPNAMIMATVNAEGRPSARTVLMKGFSEAGVVFYTNYESRKGKELAQNPHIALLFYWAELERQVRIEGVVEKISEAASTDYFHSRPRDSQLGALASPQSEVIKNRQVLEQRMAELTERYQDQEIPKPHRWGGYLVKPERFEFWQGRSSRLHDRFCYVKKEANWNIERLAP